MKITVFGAGAMGSRFGAELQLAGHEVQLVDPWDQHVRTIQDRGGLEVVSEEGTRMVPLLANLPSEGKDGADLVIVFGKATQTASLIDACRHLLAPHTVVLTLQNGLGNIETLARWVPRENLVAGVTTIGTELLGPGRIRSLGDGDTYVMQVDGIHGQALGLVLAAFDGSGIAVDPAEEVQAMIWSKVAFNSVLNTLCTLMQCEVSALRLYPRFWPLVAAILDEVIGVAAAEGVALDPASIRATIDGATDPAMSGHHLASMLQDLFNQRETEIEHLNGEIVRRGERHGIPTPYNRLICDLVGLAVATQPRRIGALPD